MGPGVTAQGVRTSECRHVAGPLQEGSGSSARIHSPVCGQREPLTCEPHNGSGHSWRKADRQPEPAQVTAAPATLPSVVCSLRFLPDGLLAVPPADPGPPRLRHGTEIQMN